MPQVNIVIPTFNRLESLKRAVLSVQQQSYTHWALTIVDDGSTDQTHTWITEYLKPHLEKKLHYIKTENYGVSHARNQGIKHLNTPYVAFLDSDDEWASNKLEIQMKYFKKNPSLKFVHSNEKWIRDNKILNQKKIHAKSGGFIFNSCTQLCLISPSTVVIHKDVFEDIGLFDENMTVCEDYDLWLRITKKYEVGFLEDELTLKYGGHSDQLSFKYNSMDYWRAKALEKHLDCSLINEESRSLVLDTLIKKCHILLKGYGKHNNLTNYNEVKTLQSKVLRLS